MFSFEVMGKSCMYFLGVGARSLQNKPVSIEIMFSILNVTYTETSAAHLG
jgi:hypothetical protein